MSYPYPTVLFLYLLCNCFVCKLVCKFFLWNFIKFTVSFFYRGRRSVFRTRNYLSDTEVKKVSALIIFAELFFVAIKEYTYIPCPDFAVTIIPFYVSNLDIAEIHEEVIIEPDAWLRRTDSSLAGDIRIQHGMTPFLAGAGFL